MAIKWKLIISLVVAGLFAGGGFYLGSGGISARDLSKQLKEALATVEQLKGERDSLETVWQSKEKDYEDKIRGLNDSLKRKQREINVLEDRLKALQAQRQNITVPDKPDDICPEFVKSGYRTCARVKRAKR